MSERITLLYIQDRLSSKSGWENSLKAKGLTHRVSRDVNLESLRGFLERPENFSWNDFSPGTNDLAILGGIANLIGKGEIKIDKTDERLMHSIQESLGIVTTIGYLPESVRPEGEISPLFVFQAALAFRMIEQEKIEFLRPEEEIGARIACKRLKASSTDFNVLFECFQQLIKGEKIE